MKHIFLVCTSIALLAGSARAGLVWENQSVNLKPGLTDETAVAHFKYKNTGQKKVKITSVQPSCGCTTAALAKKTVEPGQGGEIVATFHVGDRTGEQTKMIKVMTDAPGDKGTELTLHATIPVVLEVNPYFSYWRRIDPLNPKIITAKLGGDYPVTNLKITCTDPEVTTESKFLPNEKAFEITVTPHPGSRPVNAQLKIDPGFPKDKPRIYAAYLRIDAHPTEADPGPQAGGAAANVPAAPPRPPEMPSPSATPK